MEVVFVCFYYYQLPNWTNDGGTLKSNLEEGKDFQLLPEQLWLALHSWYQGDPQLPRPVCTHPLLDESL